ncbi:hypothetical protein MUK42_01989 [Musa troglodytarum]|uniref:Uncharacterized protein n=1 Tax=Musa troglodytarum TaxID=320322 RepID=A0A9E7GRP5_9LILI|nr:hypothetical protein MUK42_01989 [Musa troglodytarum]
MPFKELPTLPWEIQRASCSRRMTLDDPESPSHRDPSLASKGHREVSTPTPPHFFPQTQSQRGKKLKLKWYVTLGMQLTLNTLSNQAINRFNMVVWNCKGVQKKDSTSRIRHLINLHKLSILILLETHLSEQKWEHVLN